MQNHIIINSKISKFKKKIEVTSDKSLSIRTILMASQAVGKSKISNLLESEDVKNTLKTIKKLGIVYKKQKKFYEIYGFGLNGFDIEKKIVIDAGNSGTLARIILGLLVKSNFKVKIVGDKSLSKRDFLRVINPLKLFGVNIKSKNGCLPLEISGTNFLRPINFTESKSSAQIKTCLIFCALNTPGTTMIKAKKSRNHTELLCKHLSLPIKIKKFKNYDLIEVRKAKKIKTLNYKIPSDISSASFFIVLAALSDNSKLVIKNVNINPSRIGIITILKKMGVQIKFQNEQKYKGEIIADIVVYSSKKLKAINCPSKFNSGAIDEFLIIFLVAAKADGVSHFKEIGELNQKESPRLIWGSRILNKMGIKTITTDNSIKIFGNSNLKIDKKIVIKDFLKDHRVFMTSVVASLVFGGTWNIHDKDSIKTSFPLFLKIINSLRK